MLLWHPQTASAHYTAPYMVPYEARLPGAPQERCLLRVKLMLPLLKPQLLCRLRGWHGLQAGT